MFRTGDYSGSRQSKFESKKIHSRITQRFYMSKCNNVSTSLEMMKVQKALMITIMKNFPIVLLYLVTAIRTDY